MKYDLEALSCQPQKGRFSTRIPHVFLRSEVVANLFVLWGGRFGGANENTKISSVSRA